MKNTCLSIFAVAALGAMSVSALDATAVQVTLQGNKPGLAGKLVSPVESKPATISFTEGKGRAKHGWQRISIPVVVEGRAKKLKSTDNDQPVPDYVDALTFNVHVLFKTTGLDGKEKYAKVSKTLTYHEIALSKGSGSNGKCEMTVDLFVSPANAMKISTEGLRGKSTSLKVAAAAVEATFNGNACMNKDEPMDATFDRVNLPKRWWESDKVQSQGAVLYAISETPYAYVQPELAAWVTTSSTAAPVGAVAAPESDSTTPPAADADTTDGESGATPSAPAADDEETPGRRGKGKNRGRSKRSRN